MGVAAQMYPFSTEKGDSIPLDIILPLGALVATVVSNTTLPIVIPADYKLVSVYSEVPVAIDFSSTLGYPVTGLLDSALLVPAKHVVTAQIPSVGNARVIPLVAGSGGLFFMQNIQKWAGLGLNRQLNTR